MFDLTAKTTYLVRAGPQGLYGDHVFGCYADAQIYASGLASTEEAAITEISAPPRTWTGGAQRNPVDAVRASEVPPNTQVITGR
jgi:hypothetical protein